MKKRILAMVLAALLLCTVASGASGSGLICFVGINDTIPVSLPGTAAPYYDDGVLLVPYTAFDAGPNGIFISYNVDQNTFVIADRSQRLVYDLLNATVTDEEGVETETVISYRDGLLFVPGVFAAAHFGLEISLLTSVTGCPILRFKDGNQVYEDKEFVEKAETLISYMLEHYAAREEDRPQNPEEPAKDPNPENHTEELYGYGSVYLAFAGDAVARETLQHLEALDAKAAFFVTEQQILDNPDLMREIYGSGHSIGLTVPAGETDLQGSLQRANEALDRCLFFKTLLVLVPEAYDQGGYVVWSEAAQASTVEEIWNNPTIPHLLVCRNEVLRQLKALLSIEAVFPQLVETTSLPQRTN